MKPSVADKPTLMIIKIEKEKKKRKEENNLLIRIVQKRKKKNFVSKKEELSVSSLVQSHRFCFFAEKPLYYTVAKPFTDRESEGRKIDQFFHIYIYI